MQHRVLHCHLTLEVDSINIICGNQLACHETKVAM